MKTISLLLLSVLFSVTPASAVSFDREAFGNALNGFIKHKRFAKYSINRQLYVTTIPTVTHRFDGGLFITTQVHAGRWADPSNAGVLELNITPQGHLESVQIRLTANGQNLTSALIERPANEAPLVEGAEPSVDLQPWKTATNTMIQQLFADLNNQINKLEPEQRGSRDLYSRLAGKGNPLTHFPPVLRHNLNLLLNSIR